MNDDDELCLAPETLKALQEFLEERNRQEESYTSENWQLSQFWYDEETISTLSSAVLANCDNHSKVALISCPSLYPSIKTKIQNSQKDIKLTLFEYDNRFAKYEPDFTFYDYNEPLNVSSDYKNSFSVIVIDPPFLSEECLTKNAQTINYIGKEDTKIILCTGAVMEELATNLLNLKKCSFEPKHKNNLANEFICMTNFGEIQKEV